MTDETHMPEDGGTPTDPAPPPVTSEPAPATATSGMQAMMGSGQGMVTIASWVLIGLYLITGVLMNEYWVVWLMLIPAIIVVVLPRLKNRFSDGVASMPVLIKSMGYLIALVGLLVLIEDIRFASSRFDDFWYILGSLIVYGASALAFLGARAIDT